MRLIAIDRSEVGLMLSGGAKPDLTVRLDRVTPPDRSVEI